MYVCGNHSESTYNPSEHPYWRLQPWSISTDFANSCSTLSKSSSSRSLLPQTAMQTPSTLAMVSPLRVAHLAPPLLSIIPQRNSKLCCEIN
jgi:hypothetical protein